jgi:zinc protease
VTYRVGSRHENYGETGMAHLLEHLVFKGTPTTRNVWAEFQARPARQWHHLVRPHQLLRQLCRQRRQPALVPELAGRRDGQQLHRQADLDTEMTVVRNEFEAGENNPGRVLLQRTLGPMYDWHNYGKSTIGARTDIENVDISRLQAFYRRHYQPDNATLTVSGKFDTPRVCWPGCR